MSEASSGNEMGKSSERRQEIYQLLGMKQIFFNSFFNVNNKIRGTKVFFLDSRRVIVTAKVSFTIDCIASQPAADSSWSWCEIFLTSVSCLSKIRCIPVHRKASITSLFITCTSPAPKGALQFVKSDWGIQRKPQGTLRRTMAVRGRSQAKLTADAKIPFPKVILKESGVERGER